MPILQRFSRSGRDILFNGKLVKLAGIYAGGGETTTTDTLDAPFDDDMQRHAQNGNNLHRHILNPYWKYSPPSTVQPRNCCFTRTADGRWDLRSYNADYFSRLRAMISTAANYGIAVQVVLFDRTGLDASPTTNPPLRWEHSPWNDANNVNPVLKADATSGHGGLPEFYRPDPELRSTQEAYIRYVVAQTKAWNVFYEIMVEPMWGTNEERVRWADWVVGVIRSATGGLNLIFYNDHTGGARGVDVNLWKQLALPNYNNFHGVIFHGTPTDYDPNNTAYAFRNEKIFQVSTDAGPSPARDTYDANFAWCRHAFDPSRRMMFQAHAKSLAAAQAIRDNHPSVIEPEFVDPVGPLGVTV